MSQGKDPQEKNVPTAEAYAVRSTKLLSPGDLHKVPTAAGSGPWSLPREDEGERRTPYLLFIRHPILEVGHLGLLWPSPVRARGRPGRKLGDGIARGPSEGPARKRRPRARRVSHGRGGGGGGSRRQRPRKSALPEMILSPIAFSLRYVHVPTHLWDAGTVF